MSEQPPIRSMRIPVGPSRQAATQAEAKVEPGAQLRLLE